MAGVTHRCVLACVAYTRLRIHDMTDVRSLASSFVLRVLFFCIYYSRNFTKAIQQNFRCPGTVMYRSAILSFIIQYTRTASFAVTVLAHTGWPKMAPFLYALTSSNINLFAKLFDYHNQEKICNNTVTKDPTAPRVKCFKSNNWKQDDFCSNTLHMLINYQQGTTCLLSLLLSKVTVTSCRSSAGILHGCLQQDGEQSHTARNTCLLYTSPSPRD